LRRNSSCKIANNRLCLRVLMLYTCWHSRLSCWTSTYIFIKNQIFRNSYQNSILISKESTMAEISHKISLATSLKTCSIRKLLALCHQNYLKNSDNITSLFSDCYFMRELNSCSQSRRSLDRKICHFHQILLHLGFSKTSLIFSYLLSTESQ